MTAFILYAAGIKAVAAADKNWATYLGDAGATHYSTLKQINTRNVGRLEPAWTYRCGDASTNNRSQIQCNPLVVDGVLYGTSPQLKLFALEAATGRELWRMDPFALETNAPSLGVNRGLVLWRDGKERRLLYCAGYYLHAVDPGNGQLIRSFGKQGKVDLREDLGRDPRGMMVLGNTPGAIYKDLLIVSTRVNESLPSAPGHIRAYDVRTGRIRWTFHTIPYPGEYGYDTWPPDAWQHIGGANCWAGLTIDHQRGLAFIPTGSAAFDFWGGNRIGANLFANCLLALDAATGKRRWHFQVVRHDLWDRDLPAPPVLCEVRRNGKKIPAVAQITKSGHVWVFHRETGESLFPWREVPVPSSDVPGEVASTNQPVPLKPEPFARQLLTEDLVTDRTPAARDAAVKRLREARPHRFLDPPSRTGTVIFPGFDGAGEWGGAAVDPKGILYVNSNEMAWIFSLVDAQVSKGPHASGHAIYIQMCAPCHGINREGETGRAVPTLVGIEQKLKALDIVNLLGTGRGTMPSFDFLQPAEKEATAAYLLQLPNSNEAPPSSPTQSASSIATRLPYTITGYHRFVDSEGYPALKPPWGTLNAIDLNTGEYAWKLPLGEWPELTAKGIPPTGSENYGGPVVTAGGVLFIGATRDEKFRAFDARTGTQLWDYKLPAAGYATPATYSVKGRQYVVIACGGGKLGTKSGDAYVAFALPQR